MTDNLESKPAIADPHDMLAFRSLFGSLAQQHPTAPVRTNAESRACGKVILSGEHAVVYGAKAIAVPLLSRFVSLKFFADKQISAQPRIRFQLGDRPAHEHLREMVLEAFDVLGVPRFHLSLEGSSTLMLGAGVGSSASLCVGVLRGLAQLTGKSITPVELARKANQLERRFHGNPSGLDTAVVALEQAILFERGKDPNVVPVSKPTGSRFPWTFVLLDSGIRSPTISMVRLAEPFFRAEGSRVIDEFNMVTDQCKYALETGNTSIMTQAISSAHELLCAAGVVTDPLAQLVEVAQRIGALATKVTGAGGGGCVLTLLSTEQCDTQLAKLREELGSYRVHPLFIP